MRAQTFPPAGIIVVNNASADGTREWLDSQPDVTPIHQGDVGPAGGWHAGIRHAFDSGNDAIWMLDDDAMPSLTALQTLVESPAYDGSTVVGGVIVSPHDDEILAFPVPRLSTYNSLFDYYRKVTDRMSDLRAESDERGYPWGMFMNCVLLPRRVVAEVGLPKREFYMGGEETEYHYRVRSRGFGTYIVLDALCRHPKRDESGMANWRRRSLVRNTVYIHRHYRRWFVLRTLRLAVIYAATGHRDFLSPMWDGIRGDFSRRYDV
jgi:rhamnopyranosyl-N-acetylglucosaminyl-diphospho-decaprenol beta-1,3/1,4-galactofuranosyltransferase